MFVNYFLPSTFRRFHTIGLLACDGQTDGQAVVFLYLSFITVSRGFVTRYIKIQYNTIQDGQTDGRSA